MAEMTKTEVTTTVTVADLVPGDPSALVAVKRAVNSQGIARHITQRISIRSAELARRLFAEVQRGDEVTLTLTTVWADDDYETELSDFALPLNLEDAARKKSLASL